MSSALGRAFTTKRGPKPADISTPLPKRSQTTKQQSMGSLRHKISAPLELISTTNNNLHNAPDIFPGQNRVKHSFSTSSRSSNSGDESERSPASAGTSTPLTSPDTSSIEGSPTSLEPNHLSCYFGGPSRQSSSSQEAPVIPQRAVSHTKRTAEASAHQRSASRASSTKSSHKSVSSSINSSHQSVASSITSGYQSGASSTKNSYHGMPTKLSSPKHGLTQARSSINMFSAHVETVDSHPFGRELAQVSELAEDYGISGQVTGGTMEKVTVMDEDQRAMIPRGLLKFSAEDYISEIQGFIQAAFTDSKLTPSYPIRPGQSGRPVKPALATMWI